mmetsp:Transcript_12316/g.20293  ORF Transcript_12316/g.20293 Transcript_12316/m.20293 type:complete len:561 (-) Transcript_12316:32-1714(-)
MPTITDNMSEDGKSVEQRFIDILYNGGSAGELSGALGNLLRKMQHCDNLVQFIVGNGHGPAYVQRFNNCVGGGSQDIRDFLQDFANSAGFDHVNDYLNSQRADLSITHKLGFGVENNIGGVSNGVGDLGNRIRNALKFDRRKQSQATAQARVGAAEYPVPPHTPGRYANNNFYSQFNAPATPIAGGEGAFFQNGGFVHTQTPMMPPTYVPLTPNNGFYVPPGTSMGGIASFDQGHPSYRFSRGGFGSSSSQHDGSSFASNDPGSWGGRHHGGLFSAAGGKENIVNAPPSLPTQVPSVGGDASSIVGGLSQLSFSSGMKDQGQTQKKTSEELLRLRFPTDLQQVMMDRLRFKSYLDTHLAPAENNNYFFEMYYSVMESKSSQHFANYKDLLTGEESKYDDEVRDYNNVITEVDEELEAVETKQQKSMDSIQKKEEEEMMKVKAKYDSDRRRVKRECDQSKEELQEKKELYQRKKVQSNTKRRTNLALPKAALRIMETVHDIVPMYYRQRIENDQDPRLQAKVDAAFGLLTFCQEAFENEMVEHLGNHFWPPTPTKEDSANS